MTKSPLLKPLERLVGSWTTEATHPAMPGVVVHGTVVVEWLEGEQFLLHRARTDHADFPDALSVIGDDAKDRADDAAPTRDHGEPRLGMHYFDSRGVFRLYQASADDQAWRFWRDSPGFSQRFTGTFTDGGDTIVGVSQLRKDDDRWNDDLKITYRRARP
jgi:hypothetical protein